jgi:flagellar hook-associated protein 3 FlgL
MRVASAGLYFQVLDAIGRNQSEIARLQLQVATGKRILTPADDPFGATRSLQLNNAVNQLAQYQENGIRAGQRLGLEDSTLGQVVDALQRVHELAVQANNDSQTNETRGYIATEIEALMAQIVELANATDGEGGYLFGGYRSETQPFVFDANGVSYLGDQGRRMIQIGPSRQVADGDPGSDVFLAIPNGNGTFAVSANPANAGTGIADAGSVTDPAQWDGGSYTITFTTPTDYEVRDAANALVASGTFTPDSGQVVAFRGIEVGIDGAPAAGDTFQVEPSTSVDLFATLQEFIDALRTGAVDDVSEAQLHNRLNGVMTNLDQAFSRISEVRAGVGTRLRAVDEQADMNTQYSILLQSNVSDIDNVDMVQAISELDLKLTTLQASEQAFVAVQRLSLFDFL